MAKKSFNPALQFISTAEEPAAEIERTPTPAPAASAAVQPESRAQQYHAPATSEARTRRVQLVMQPSLYKRVKAAAKKGGVSVNDFIHNALDDATREE